MPIRSLMSLIMGQIEPEHLEFLALEFGKIAEYDFVYTLASPNIHPLALNLVKMLFDHKISDEFDYGFNRSRTVSCLPLNLQKLLNLTLFTL